VHVLLPKLDTGLLKRGGGREAARMGALTRPFSQLPLGPLISVAGSVIGTAGGSWHFLGQRQYERTHIQPLMYAHEDTQPCSPIPVQRHSKETQRDTCRNAPPFCGKTPQEAQTCSRTHSYLHTQGQVPMQETCSQGHPAPLRLFAESGQLLSA
jgi:hypothetical protein